MTTAPKLSRTEKKRIEQNMIAAVLTAKEKATIDTMATELKRAYVRNGMSEVRYKLREWIANTTHPIFDIDAKFTEFQAAHPDGRRGKRKAKK